MAEIVLDVETRDIKNEKNKVLRRSGLFPVVVYGNKKENAHLKIEQKEFFKKLKGSVAHNIFIDLKLKDKSEVFKTVLIKEVQKSWLSHEIEHIDFLEVDPDTKLHIDIPVILSGEAIGVTKGGGVLQFAMRELEVYCLPKNTPKEIKVDVSKVDVGESIHAGDLDLGEGVKITAPLDSVIVAVSSAAAAEKEAAPEEAKEEEQPEKKEAKK